MNSHIDLQCWEIMKCNNLDCPARSEPETPCWKIAKRIGSFRDVSNTCRDCIVYLLQNEISASINKKEKIGEILRNRESYKNIGTGYRACILKTSP